MALGTARIHYALSAKDTISTGIVSGSQDAVLKPSIQIATTLTTSSPATSAVSFALTLASSTAQIDLTSLTIPGGATASMTGLKLQAMAIAVPSGSSAMEFSVAASSGYNVAGSSWTESVPSGGYSFKYSLEQTPDVSASAKFIDVSGTGTQSCDVMMIFG